MKVELLETGADWFLQENSGFQGRFPDYECRCILTDLDSNGFVKFHKEKKDFATLAVSGSQQFKKIVI